MKKLLILSLALALTVALSSVSLGSTLGVAVEKGFTLAVEKLDCDDDSFYITGNYGVSDNLRITLGYSTENDDGYDSYLFGVRYEITDNVAVNFGYETADYADLYSLDLRGKLALSEQLALTGLIQAWRYDGGCDTELFVMGQAEYSFNDFITGNLGAEYDDSEEVTNLIAGFEIYPNDTLTFWADYSVDVDDSDNDNLGLGMEIAF